VVFDRLVRAMIVHDDGTGQSLYIGGGIRPVPGFDGRGVARWDGAAWFVVGAGLTPFDTGVQAFAAFDDGTGLALYAGGGFTVPGYTGTAQRHLARWNGSAWTPFGSPNGGILGMIVFDDGHGAALWIAGSFSSIGGTQASGVASWNGATWVPRHGSWDVSWAYRFAVYQSRLYMSASFNIGGSLVGLVARWTAEDWEIVGIPTGDSPAAANMAVWDDGAGSALYVTGRFTAINGVSSPLVARFDGDSWSSVGGGYPTSLGTAVPVVGTTAEPLGPALYVGGFMPTTPPGLQHIGRYTSCIFPDPCYPNCDASTATPILNVEDFTCFITEFASAFALPPQQQLDHYANCDQSTTPPVLNVQDFTCFINRFAQGCP
jgi:hypothetical protein